MPGPTEAASTQEAVDAIQIFPWDDNFNTGLEVVDTQHHRLVEILNRLATRYAYDADNLALEEIFNDLLEYTHYHFETEEGIWERYFGEDASIVAHRESHRHFVEELAVLIADYRTGMMRNVADETLAFLVRWLASHILESDRYMAYTVAAMEAGAPLEAAKSSAVDQMSGFTRKMIDIILSIYATLTHNTLHLMQELIARRRAEASAQVHEKKLAQHERLLRTVIDEIPDALSVRDHQGAVLLCNRAFAHGFDATPETMVGQRQDSGTDVERIMELGKTQILYRETEKSGEEPRHYKSIRKPFFDIDGSNRLLEIDHDITDLIRIRTELTRQRGFLQTLIHTIPDLIWLKDSEGLYLACNQRFERFFGAPEAEIVGKTDYDFVPIPLADSFRANDRLAIERGDITVNEETIVFADDGHEELLEMTKTPMFDESGNLIGVLGVGHDITEIRRTTERLQASEESFRSLFNSLREAVFVLDELGVFLGVNAGAERLYGYDESWFVGKTAKALEASEHNDFETLRDAFKQAWQGLTQSFEFWSVRDNGSIFPTEMHLTQGDWFGKKVVFAVALDITERWEHQEQLERVAHYDALTELPNRRMLADRLQQAMVQAQRRDTSIAVAYLDLDGFKAVNDQYGHATGDKLLLAISRRMQTALREGDTLARLGGDEFVAVLLDLADVSSCIPILDRLLEVIAEPIAIEHRHLKVSASLGVTFFPQDEEVDADQLIRQGDQAMYFAKQSGKNRFHLFDAEYDRSMRGRHESIEAIGRALVNEEFRLYYQPKVEMSTGRIYGVEALIRWIHPECGLLEPMEFLPVIANHRLAIAVGEWVLEETLAQIENWRARGLELQVSINIDVNHLQQSDFVESLQEALRRHPAVGPGDLELEILETAALEDMEHALETIRACGELGVGVAIDDFGTGYSSLTYLKRLPVDRIKLDKSFVRDMLDDPDDLAILDGVMELARVFECGVIAEGVESIEHGTMLLQMGCRYAQGFVIAEPMPAEALPEWVWTWRPDPVWLKTHKLERDALKMLYAMVKHRAWTHTLEAYLQSPGSAIRPPLDTAGCGLGKWMQSEEAKPLAHYPEFARIRRLREMIHTDATRLVETAEQGGSVNPAALEAILDQRDALTTMMKTLLGIQEG